MPIVRTVPFRFVRSFLSFFLVCFTVAFLVMSKREFDEVTINQVLFHMQLMKDNIVTMPGDFIHVFLWHVRNAVLCALTFAFLREAAVRRQEKPGLLFAAVCLAFVALWFIVPGSFIDDAFVAVRWIVVAALVISAAGAAGLAGRLARFPARVVHWLSGGWRLAGIWFGILLYSMFYVNFFTFFQEQAVLGDFYTEGAYIDPRTVKVSGTGTKNLIIIYCESIEDTFGRSDVMGEDLLAPLRPSIETPDLRIDQMPGADFTIGGIVASQCGIPLKSISILSGNLTGWALDRYLPGAVCLGDYLKADGYHNVYYNGSSGVFSGLNKFFLSHGYQEFMGKEDWIEKKHVDPATMNTWAMYDSDMVDRSIARIDELMAEGKKFSFALSTMDTHEPGFLSPPCVDEGFSENWSGYVKCSLSQVERLLRHIRDKGWEDKFVILVMGDHQARMAEMDNVELKHVKGRYVLCSLQRDATLKPVRSIITHFDLFPTLLTALGFSVQGERLGFGYNVFSSDVQPEANYRDRLRKRVLSHSKVYESLWLPEYAERDE
ncbi:sulfatase-like hydrolase/transferase [uncultured Mailhella sp.]|uniref:sulfatase-like hydrolase/transferase n=1 Tax=uncultured Mailhella sp. TaxID=1981031 RepID=UPI0025F501FF|nr:sulfatase-like hydrolase/transferase [uncultured Mailhella sp.]